MKILSSLTAARLAVLSVIAMLFFSCSAPKKTDEAVTDETGTTPGEWITLFNGETLDGWKRYGADEIGPLWRVENGEIVCSSEGGGEALPGTGGSLITVEQFDNFELELDWKISPGGNSGILYHVVEDTAYQREYETGPEFQLIDDDSYGADITELQKTGANYDMYAASQDKKVNPPGEWNSARIVYDRGRVEHWLNGARVLEFTEGSDDWKARYEESKWVDYPGWCKYKSGAIALQDHGHYIWFRNIRIRRL